MKIMKNKFLYALAALAIFAVGCEDDKVGNPDEVIANTVAVHSPTVNGFFVDGEIYGAGITERGVVYGRGQRPTFETIGAVDGLGEPIDPEAGSTADPEAGAGAFTLEVTGLISGADYYVRTYAKSGENVAYGTPRAITTRPNPFFEALQSLGLIYGTVRTADKNLAMHYSFDQEKALVTLTWLEPDGDSFGDAKHVTLPVTYNAEYSAASWDATSNGDISVSGIALNGTSSASVTGSAGLVLDEPFTTDEVWKMYSHSNFGGLNRISEFRPVANGGDNHVSIDGMWASPDIVRGVELNAEITAIVGLGGSTIGGYTYRRNVVDGNGRPTLPQYEDKITFSKGDIYTGYSWGHTDPATIAQIEGVLAPFYDFWYQPDGLIMVRATDDGKAVAGEAGSGGIYYYAISATGEGWVKLWFREWGQ
jgi:hypothetical protein